MVWHCQILSNIIECMFPRLWARRFTYIKPMFLSWCHLFILAVHLWYYLFCQSRGSYEITLLVNCNKQCLTCNTQILVSFVFTHFLGTILKTLKIRTYTALILNRALFQLNQNFYWLLWIIKNWNKIIKKSIIIISRENRSK